MSTIVENFPDNEPNINSEALEIIGRLYLWTAAIRECMELLEFANKVKAARNSPKVRQEHEAYYENLQNFVKTLPDYKEGSLLKPQIELFKKTNDGPFLTFHDFFKPFEWSIMLAVIFFCQIQDNSNGQRNICAKNDETFRNTHLTPILNKIFETQEDIEKFHLFNKKLKIARDKMIGHADAEAFNISHGDKVSSFNMYCKSIDNIIPDLDYWLSFLELFPRSILIYENEIKTQAQAQVSTNQNV